jgi:sialate O-acetylesterase
MERTSAIAYFFGRKLSKELNVPVGIIVAAWGGTPAEVWVPAERVLTDSILSRCTLKDYPWWPKKPGVLYNQMIAPFVPYKLAGCIWYQGESNHPNATSYGRLMKTLIESWRENFKTHFPFLLFQIAPYTYGAEHNTPALLREQQEWLENNVADTKMINISDVVDNVKDIHPKDKRTAGERMTNLALTVVYHKQGYPCSHPKFGSVSFNKKNAVITFKDGSGRIVNKGKDIVGVTAFVEGKWIKVGATLRNNKLLVPYPKGQKIEAVRYCFDDATIGSLQSSDGLPLLPFRTDHFSE